MDLGEGPLMVANFVGISETGRIGENSRPHLSYNIHGHTVRNGPILKRGPNGILNVRVSVRVKIL